MLRDFINELDSEGLLVKIQKPVSAKFEAAGVLKALDGKPVLFESVMESELKIIGNIFATRELVAKYLKTTPTDLLFKMADAIAKPTKPKEVGKAPFNEKHSIDLTPLPILTHCEGDGGPYLSSSVVAAKDKEYGGNLSFHRMMVVDKKHLALRILPRHLNEFIKRNEGELDVAVCVGGTVPFLLAAATSVEIGFDELTIANSLEPMTVSPSPLYKIPVPTETEIVIEGRITKKLVPEGKFVDLTETHDIVRQQPLMEVKRVSYRKDAYYQALLPGGLEHKTLMGMPREPTIYREVNKVCKCTSAYLTPGGCSWLHGVVQIDKKNKQDGKKAIEAAFAGHPSMKFVVVVDKDINILDPNDIEWALATRVQADTAVIIKPNEKGSSLDPSADPNTRKTAKWGVDATKPLVAKGKDFERVPFPKVRLEEYLPK
ncbi:MAG: UbiD family decarboxylase [Candidatus Micrarchaeota archaeon]